MAELFGKNLERIDFPVDPDDGEAGYGSTDCGNVSQAIPTIHPYIRISPDGIPGHSREFAEWAKSPLARTGMVAGAKALALTALDLVAKPDRAPAGQGRVREERGADAGRQAPRTALEYLAGLPQMVEDVEPEDDGVGLPVELLDPVQRRLAPVRAP